MFSSRQSTKNRKKRGALLRMYCTGVWWILKTFSIKPLWNAYWFSMKFKGARLAWIFLQSHKYYFLKSLGAHNENQDEIFLQDVRDIERKLGRQHGTIVCSDRKQKMESESVFGAHRWEEENAWQTKYINKHVVFNSESFKLIKLIRILHKINRYIETTHNIIVLRFPL